MHYSTPSGSLLSGSPDALHLEAVGHLKKTNRAYNPRPTACMKFISCIIPNKELSLQVGKS